MRLPSRSDLTGAAALARRAAGAAPGVAVRLVADDRAVAAVRRVTGSASLKRTAAGRDVLLVGTDAGAEPLRAAGALVRIVGEREAAEAVRRSTPDILVICSVPLAEPGAPADFDLAAEAIEHTYLSSVRTILAALPAMRDRRWGQIIAASAAAPEASAGDRAAAVAQAAFLRVVSAEVVGDGVQVTSVNLPSDPERADRRIVEAVALRPRRAPVRLPV